MRTFLDECTELFKGHILYSEIKNMPYPELIDMRETRTERYARQQAELEKQRQQQEQAALQNRILAK